MHKGINYLCMQRGQSSCGPVASYLSRSVCVMTQKRLPSDQLTLFQCIRQDPSEAQSNKIHCHGIESNAGDGSQDSDSPAG